MIALTPTPLERVPPGVLAPEGGPALYLKREDLLPYGGGAKVRRLLPWLTRPSPSRRIAVLSDRGAHTFLTLARMLRSGDLPVESLLFWERDVAPTPYRERVRREYADDPRIDVRTGSFARLWPRLALARLAGADVRVLGIGGSTGDGSAHDAAFRECADQLAAASVRGRVRHVLPVASGQAVEGFRRTREGLPGPGHSLLGVLTGPAAVRPRLRRRLRGAAGVSLGEADDDGADVARALGVPLDPVHAGPAASCVLSASQSLGPADAIVLWVTCPRTAPPA